MKAWKVFLALFLVSLTAGLSCPAPAGSIRRS